MKTKKLLIYEALWNLSLFLIGAYLNKSIVTLAIVLVFTCVGNMHYNITKKQTPYICFIWGLINSIVCVFYFSFLNTNAALMASAVMIVIVLLLVLEINKSHKHTK